ncbi:MAG TPA: N-6 DNA methylase, partial [Methanothrix sp.]
MRVFQAVRIEGGLFAPDLFDQMLAENLPGQKPQDFGLDGRRGLTDEIAAVFADATDIWRVFKHRIENLEETDPGTSVTRDAWVIPFLGLIGYELYYNRRAHTIDGLTFAISHRAGEHDDAPPVHIVGVNQDLGRVASSGRPRLAPHTLLQEFLNRTDALWGITTNGRVLRLLRDSTYIRRQCYVEFDLEAIFEQRLFQDFVILYRLIHRTRLPKAGADAHHCFLERYYQNSVEQGGRVRDKLRDGVEECIKRLANGFLAHPKNDDLRKRITNRADDRRITPEDLYRQLLRLVYRFLFLMVSEDRGLISSNPLYLNHYSITRLRRLVDDRSAYTGHHDLWISFRLLWRLLSEDSRFPQIGNRPPAELLDLPVLDGDLFDPIYLDECHITNRDLLSALWYLINYQDSPSSPPRRVNYAALDVEELGSVYESLLDYHPWINTSGTPSFDLRPGSERKSTGSYYTPAELVGELVRSALNPVVEDRLKDDSTREDQERALLSIRVVDPACGSGHFLLAAARHLGKMLARIRTGAGEPSPEEVRSATRDVITHCIYGVDKNPLAVELCRVALWIEGYTPGKPLTFLDHRIRCGDSLVGVIDLNVLKSGIPDEAFAPVSGEDRKRASALKRQNKNERLNRQLTDFDLKPDIDRILAESRALARIQDKSLQDIEDKKKRYELQQKAGGRLRAACDLWVAAFFQWYDQSKPGGITTAALRGCLRSGDACPEMGLARTLARNNRFFHWPLEFPEVFEQGGFDVVLGNPPWERIKLQEQEFFATRDPEIANAPNAAARKRLIKRLAETKPELWKEYLDTLHNAESTSRFLRGSGLYPLTGRGDINTYSVFAERMRRLLRDGGRAGIIVP